MMGWLRNVTNQANVSMFSATDGNQRVALARAHRPDVILMDINLPGISGFEAMNILRNDPTTKHIPIKPLAPMPCCATSRRGWKRVS